MSGDRKMIFACDVRRSAFYMIFHDNFCDLVTMEADEVMMMVVGDLVIINIGDRTFADDVVCCKKAQFTKDRGTVRCEVVLLELRDDIGMRYETIFCQ